MKSQHNFHSRPKSELRQVCLAVVANRVQLRCLQHVRGPTAWERVAQARSS